MGPGVVQLIGTYIGTYKTLPGSMEKKTLFLKILSSLAVGSIGHPG